MKKLWDIYFTNLRRTIFGVVDIYKKLCIYVNVLRNAKYVHTTCFVAECTYKQLWSSLWNDVPLHYYISGIPNFSLSISAIGLSWPFSTICYTCATSILLISMATPLLKTKHLFIILYVTQTVVENTFFSHFSSHIKLLHFN